MLIAERRRRILDQVRHRGYASFRELADELGISESTVRRDLRMMVTEGLLESTRGGVGVASATPTVSLTARGAAHPMVDPVEFDREAIAAHAAAMVVAGSAVLLGPGRSTYALARQLSTIDSLTVVTNSMRVTQAFADVPQVDVVMVGGTLRRSIGALVGPITEQNLQGLRGSQVFLSGDGVTVERGLTTPNVFAAATDQAFAAAARQVIVLADHTKIGHDTMCQTVPSDHIDVLITDAAADSTTLRRLAAVGVDVQIAR